jgi:hypothetical protein
VGTPEAERSFGRPRRRWEDYIKLDLQEVKLRGMEWIDLAQDSEKWWVLGNTVTNLQFPQNACNSLICCGTVSFSGRTLLHGTIYRP